MFQDDNIHNGCHTDVTIHSAQEKLGGSVDQALLDKHPNLQVIEHNWMDLDNTQQEIWYQLKRGDTIIAEYEYRWDREGGYWQDRQNYRRNYVDIGDLIASYLNEL